MKYTLYNAIKTPDGTILWCKNGHDYQAYTDKVSGEWYMNDGTGCGIRRSVNIIPYEDLSITTDDDFEKIRTAKFWASYGKDGKSPKIMLALQDMEVDHIQAILATQKQVKGTVLEPLFKKELNYRKAQDLKEKLEEEVPLKKIEKKKNKM